MMSLRARERAPVCVQKLKTKKHAESLLKVNDSFIAPNGSPQRSYKVLCALSSFSALCVSLSFAPELIHYLLHTAVLAMVYAHADP